jgi:hypothetical protein
MLAHALRKLIWIAALAIAAQAHIGSPDVYLDGKAGPYRLFVSIRPPDVIPGVAQLQIRSQSPGVREIRVVPIPLTGAAAKTAPVPDKLTASQRDPQFFTGSLWIMEAGSWQVRIAVQGSNGAGVLSVPLPAAALTTKNMQTGLALLLSALMVFLIAGLVAIVGANIREAKLNPGVPPDTASERRARIAMSIAMIVIIGLVWLGDRWWNAVESDYRQDLYKPLQMDSAVDPHGVLTLHIQNTEATRQIAGFGQPFFARSVDDLVPDHNHLMHLYAVRQPGLDVVYHLHPELAGSGVFRLNLPSMPAGDYRLYVDIVHANGFPETLLSNLHVAGFTGRPLSGDDASATAQPWNVAPVNSTAFVLPDGYRMEWLRDSAVLHARQPSFFRFHLLDPQGRPARDLSLYMGMLGHAAFLKTDGTVFAHIHPTGSVSMAAFMMAQNSGAQPETTGMQMPGMDISTSTQLPAEVSFPYGFPTPGRYRIFVQMKHSGVIETGVFDPAVE